MFYETDKDNEILCKYNLSEYSKKVNAFTVRADGLKAVFINRNTSVTNKLYSLLHETGHIILEHLETDRDMTDERLQDMQAEAFAYGVLNKCFKSCV